VPPTPSPSGTWSAIKAKHSCDGNSLKTLKDVALAACKAECEAEPKCGCIDLKHGASGKANCELNTQKAASQDAGYDAYTYTRN
jgi:hypothetical protein